MEQILPGHFYSQATVPIQTMATTMHVPRPIRGLRCPVLRRRLVQVGSSVNARRGIFLTRASLG